MKFCSSCKKPLEFFEFLDGDLCDVCQKNASKPKKPSQGNSPDGAPGLESLLDATFSVDNGKLVLTSAEGWVLWSGAADQPNSLENILHRARRINDIRKKRRTKQ